MARQRSLKRRSPIARQIEQLRKENEWSTGELAKRLKTNRRRIWRIENGDTELLAREVPKFARAFGVSVAELYAGAA